MKFYLLALLSVLCFADKKADFSHGFRSEIDWVPYRDAVGIAKDLNKPVFLLIHKTWCGACKALKREFKSSANFGDLLKLSEKFVMINVEDDEEPDDPKFAPDGGYIPRILFLDTDGEPMKTNNELKYKNNKYFYPLLKQIIDGMERALIEFEGLESKAKEAPEGPDVEANAVEEDEEITKEETSAEDAGSDDAAKEEPEKESEEVLEEEEKEDEKDEKDEPKKKIKKEKEESKDEL